MNPESRPEAVPFAPGSGELPPALGSALTDPDTPLLLIVAPDAGADAVRTAIGLAEARAQEAGRTILADAAFGSGRIHETLDVPNLEGVADMFEFGASLSRVVTRSEARSFEFIPSGPYVPDAGAILRSDRWDRIAEEVAEASAALLVFVPATAPGLAALSRRAGRAVVVGDPESADRAIQALDPDCEVAAVVAPIGVVPPEELAAEAGPATEIDATLLGQPELTEPVVFRSDQRAPDTTSLLWLLAAVALAVAGWLGYRTFLAPAAVPPAAAVEDTAPAAPRPEPRPVETPIGFSVAVEAHQDLSTARDRLTRLREDDPDVSYYIAPVPISGSVWYRVLAGPVADREAGAALMRRLVDAGHKTAFDDWAVRPTEYAFLLGEFGTREQAERRVAGLSELGIPAYVTPIEYEPGELRYRVYGGAFESPAAADVMEEMLTEARIRAPLVERVGVPLEVDG
ncbi:MAG: SPOR domain-containing protein [Candidatus Longimicrobiales bacterium M2_2A_002]